MNYHLILHKTSGKIHGVYKGTSWAPGRILNTLHFNKIEIIFSDRKRDPKFLADDISWREEDIQLIKDDPDLKLINRKVIDFLFSKA